jgi:predicted nuclease of predicted toxin-antitoxin system
MKFLLDHDIPVDVSYSLRQLGHRVFRLPDVLNPATADEEVLNFARQRGLILITCNRDDFLQLAGAVSHAGIIVLIRRKTRAAERAALIRLLDKAGEVGLRRNINFA